ncbi:MAG: UDP-N-acetylglucosamine--LPS N-acetylglucosamine transferase [Actinobacteria bacterium BACL15 MAG-120823-bin78]|jgi:UDP-N-acetylglucosamine:LPS N-acetylglucosamine transferase|uniref:UDP-N-acetylglucosamine--LPS N-acetylglucosamine transferase n=1 Tax=Actinobacteria bacterium BACL15 MAG-120823-bin78 TaxID=1655563 RepID=A0A0R2PK85_9ACTN|nr:MAG: UDP-N-acetylglucosamine--LPS N-acetylglucosamine transferase [Actinobacteria bacterium BACL15 MAG-120823-bin78]
MEKPTIILATSNGVGMGHLARASALAISLKEIANPIIVSMAGGIAEIPGFMDIRCEYIPGKDRMWMSREKWDIYLRDRLLALVEETNAKVLTFDGVVPYPGVIAAKNSNPNLKLVWVRRGLWQKKPQRYVLGLQSAMMDKIIEPGDVARAYDFGPTSTRKDAVLTSPVSLFRKADAMSREDARKALGLDQNRPTVLVQLGTGDSDVNEKMTAALSGLLGWKDLQVILTKAPVDKNGNSLAPEGLDLKVVRYFPLANVLHAFDAGICATGYNGVHELLPAQVPTVFVSNIRGTDDQEARAKWCNDFGFALRADQADHEDITSKVKMLQDPAIRARLSAKCAELPETSGGDEIAAMLYKLAVGEKPKGAQNLTFIRLTIQERLNRGLRNIANLGLRRIAIIYRILNPHIVTQMVRVENPIFGSQTTSSELHQLIKGDVRFEHIISGASDVYRKRREEIADAAYGKRLEVSKK